MLGGAYDLYFDHQGSHPDDPVSLMSGMSARFTVNWVMTGTNWQNGSHGPDFGIIMPRPIREAAFVFCLDFGCVSLPRKRYRAY